jgi:hypothetical protein
VTHATSRTVGILATALGDVGPRAAGGTGRGAYRSSANVGYRLAADLVVLLHLAFVAFVVLGGVLAFRWPRAPWLHLPAAVWGVLIEWSGGGCPLTPLEIVLRQLGGEAGYAGGFIEHYVLPVLYPRELTRPIQVVLGAAVLLANLVIYGLWWRRVRRASPRSV